MFKIIEGDFKNNKYSDEEYLDNWYQCFIFLRMVAKRILESLAM